MAAWAASHGDGFQALKWAEIDERPQEGHFFLNFGARRTRCQGPRPAGLALPPWSPGTTDVLTVQTSSGHRGRGAHKAVGGGGCWACPWVYPQGDCPAGGSGEKSQANWGQSVRDTSRIQSREPAQVMQQNEEREREKHDYWRERKRENVNNTEKNTQAWPSELAHFSATSPLAHLRATWTLLRNPPWPYIQVETWSAHAKGPCPHPAWSPLPQLRHPPCAMG